MQHIRINEASESSLCATWMLKVILIGLMTKCSKLSRFYPFTRQKFSRKTKGDFRTSCVFAVTAERSRALQREAIRIQNEPFRVIFVVVWALFEGFCKDITVILLARLCAARYWHLRR